MSTPIILPEVGTRVQVRFSDTDAMGHVSSGSYAAWAEVGRADFFAAMTRSETEQSDIPWFVLVHLGLDFHAEGRYGETFDILTRCSKLGGKSMTFEQRIVRRGSADVSPDAAYDETRGDARVCTIQVVMACFDRKARAAIPVPSHWRLAEPREDPPLSAP